MSLGVFSRLSVCKFCVSPFQALQCEKNRIALEKQRLQIMMRKQRQAIMAAMEAAKRKKNFKAASEIMTLALQGVSAPIAAA